MEEAEMKEMQEKNIKRQIDRQEEKTTNNNQFKYKQNKQVLSNTSRGKILYIPPLGIAFH